MDHSPVEADAPVNTGVPADADAPMDAGRLQRFHVILGHGPCPEGKDCRVSVALHADGRLMADRSATTQTVEEIRLTQQETDRLVELLSDPAFVTLMRAKGSLCPPRTDVSERMTLEYENDSVKQNTTFCRNPPLVRVRDALRRLTVERLGRFDPGFHSDSGWCLGVDEGMCPELERPEPPPDPG